MKELVIGKDLSWMDAYPAVHEPQTEYTSRTIKKKRCNKSLKTDVA
jgi:hypothetical protein